MRSRLEQLAHRLIEVDAMLAEPDTASAMDRFRKLSRERAELEPVVTVFNQFLATEGDIQTARDMQADPEMRDMADEELALGEDRLEKLAAELQILLHAEAFDLPVVKAHIRWNGPVCQPLLNRRIPHAGAEHGKRRARLSGPAARRLAEVNEAGEAGC